MCCCYLLNLDSKKELYDLSQQFMLMTRYISLFAKVIWAHPQASRCSDVSRCRERAIEYLAAIPYLRDRMFAVWQRGQESSRPVGKELIGQQLLVKAPKYPSPDAAFPASRVQPGSPVTTESPQKVPPAKRQHSACIQGGISIPFDLPSTFQAIAKSNTEKGIETCGVLLGYQQGESLLITTVMVPRQTGTRDTCETLPGAEEKILSYALTNELACLGWIHTHPTQSCFLSSVDMHTSLSYQQMLPSAVAIVIAPTDKELPIGVWRLTRSGMEDIRKCPLRGFHTHESKEALTKLIRDVHWDPTMNVVVVDHRYTS